MNNKNSEPAMFGYHLIQFANAYAEMSPDQREAVTRAVETDDFVREEKTDAINAAIARPLAGLIDHMTEDDGKLSASQESLYETLDRFDGWLYLEQFMNLETGDFEGEDR